MEGAARDRQYQWVIPNPCDSGNVQDKNVDCLLLQDRFPSLLYDLPDVNLQNIANAQERVESRIPRICFQTAYERLTQARLFRQGVSGNPKPFSFRNQKPYNFGADFAPAVVFCHSLKSRQKTT